MLNISRLDFVSFDLDPGSSTLTPCDRDRVELLSPAVSSTGGSNRVGPLCGDNVGQHAYLPVQDLSSAAAMIRITTAARAANLTAPYLFNIKVTQIDCTDESNLDLRGDRLTLLY